MEEPWSPVASVAATRAASPTETVNSIATDDGLRTRVILVGIGYAALSSALSTGLPVLIWQTAERRVLGRLR